ncbi:Ku protein [Cellulomonas endophytica]|uniref:non-homologous end joining protein Ku n=1 Tax=Cellulomonas endophytica TaxID=2494735 RepID=UPI00101358F7|nr:Ku protein [Cellulomonas endophytica]
MRPIWKGAVAFGLVNVPVKLYAATGQHEVSLHQVHRADGGRIRYKKVCSVDGEPVEMAQIAKGYETADGELVVLTDEDFANLPLTTSREIEVLEFVPAEQVDPILLDRTYYLEPDKTAAKPYALLRGALEASDRMAVVKVALRQRESMAVLRVRGKVIVLQTLLWPDEVREADFPVLDADVNVRPQELTMASSLVESLAGDFDTSEFHDRYEAALTALIEQKVTEGRTQPVPAAAGEAAPSDGGGEVVDLLAALQRSVEKARAGGKAGAASSAGTATATEARADDDAEKATTPARTRRRGAAGAEDDADGAPAPKARSSRSKAAAKPADDAAKDAKDDDEAPKAAPRRTRKKAS